MNKPLRRIFFGLALLALLFAALVAGTNSALGESCWTSKQFWAAVLCAALLALAGRRLERQGALNLLLVLGTLIFIEGGFQAVGWLGLMPGVNTKMKAPYGRVYWTREGLGNSIRNSSGWYDPEFNIKARSKIALIGDSMVDAVEIHRSQHQGMALEKMLRAAGRDSAVLSFGNHGTSPAYHRDVIDYAARHFQPEEVIMYIAVVNDVSDSSPVLNRLPPQVYIYYELDSANRLQLNPQSAGARAQFLRSLEFSHRSPFFTLAATVSSHLMSVQLLVSLRNGMRDRQPATAAGAPAVGEPDPVAQSLKQVGVIPQCFRAPPDAEVEKAMTVLLKSIAACKEICERNGMRLKLVTVPHFPQWFYGHQKGRDWTLQFGEYDFQAPERRIGIFAAANGIPVLELGQWIKTKRLNVNEIQQLYLSNGSGHLSEAGHRFCADAVFQTFYSGPRP